MRPGEGDRTELVLDAAETCRIPFGCGVEELPKGRDRRFHDRAEQILLFFKVRIKGAGCDIGVPTDHTEGRTVKAVCQKLLLAALKKSGPDFIILRKQLGHLGELSLTKPENSI